MNRAPRLSKPLIIGYETALSSSRLEQLSMLSSRAVAAPRLEGGNETFDQRNDASRLEGSNGLKAVTALEI